MPESRTYKPTDVEKNLADWISLALAAGGYQDVPVIYQNQGAYRLERPFVTMQIISDGREQDPSEAIVIVDGAAYAELTELRSGVVSIIAYGSESWQMMRIINRSLRDQSITAANSLVGLEVVDSIGSIQDIPALMSTTTEPRRTQDYVFSYCETTRVAAPVDVLNRVVASGDIYRVVPADGVDPEVDESWPPTP